MEACTSQEAVLFTAFVMKSLHRFSSMIFLKLDLGCMDVAQVFTAAVMSFAHGSNDVANAVRALMLHSPGKVVVIL